MRAHLAWFTAMATDGNQWGIAAFTGRRPDMATVLGQQDGLFTLVTRGADGDEYSVVDSIDEVLPGGDIESFVARIASPETAIVTLTVTEAPYLVGLDELRRQTRAAKEEGGPNVDTNVLVRLGFALARRAEAGGGPLAVVSCDNLQGNGEVVRSALAAITAEISADVAQWFSCNVSCVSTSVDRITPRTEPELLEEVSASCGYRDLAPVVTEPFAQWILSGAFPAGRPNWESAGAEFVEDIEPYERRKLWLLNGAHSLLAYLGLLRGHETVARAMQDAVCADAVEAWWTEASQFIPAELDTADYTAALAQRFTNARIEHRLEQIANDGFSKLRQRVVPVALLDLAAGGKAEASAGLIAAWIVASRGSYGFTDAAEEAAKLPGLSTEEALAALSPELAAHRDFAARVAAAAAQLLDRAPVDSPAPALTH